MPLEPAQLIHPQIIQQWIVAAINDAATGVDAYLADIGSSIRINNRVYPRRRAPRAEQNSDQTLWPFVAYNAPGEDFDTAGGLPLVKDGVYTVVFAMWYPALPDGMSLEDYCSTGALAVQSALGGQAHVTTANGVVHVCDFVGQIGPLTEGPEGFEVCEAGYQYHIYAT